MDLMKLGLLVGLGYLVWKSMQEDSPEEHGLTGEEGIEYGGFPVEQYYADQAAAAGPTWGDPEALPNRRRRRSGS